MLAVIDYRGVKNEGLLRFGKIMEHKTVVAHSAGTDIRLLGHVTGVSRLLYLPRSRGTENDGGNGVTTRCVC
jgi:hypothetical protein